jgi:hypothetical protein
MLTLVTLIQSIQLLRKLYPNLKQSIFLINNAGIAALYPELEPKAKIIQTV